jgi:hypothetical protein
MSQSMFLKMRASRIVFVIATLIGAGTWALSAFGPPRTENADALLQIVALPYWTLIGIPGAVLAIDDAWALEAPAPYAFAMVSESRIVREIELEVLCVVIGATLAAMLVSLGARRIGGRAVSIVAAVALAGVALRLPWSVTYSAPTLTRIAERIGAAVTLPGAAIMRLLDLPLLLGRPGDSPPLFFASTAIAHGLLVVVTSLAYGIAIWVIKMMLGRRHFVS